MNVTGRHATAEDLDDLARLFYELEAEQAAIKPMWPLADGLDEPAETSLKALIDDVDSVVVIGEIDGVALGFLWARSEALLAQAGGERVGVIRLIYTEPEARGVGVGHEMVVVALDELRRRGLRLFDARVSPGHRHAKNFFEAHGFAARLIVMHHDDAPFETR